MLYLAGIFITFFLAIVLLTKKGKTTSDNILSAWLFIVAIHLWLFYAFISGKLYDHPNLLGLGLPLPLFHGPFLYLYTLLETRDNKFKRSYWLHFLPPLLAFAVIWEFFMLPAEEKIFVFKNDGRGWEIHTSIILIAIIFSGFTYVFLSLRELRLYRKRINEEFSNTEKINLNWLRYLIFGILFIWLEVLLTADDPLVFGTVVLFVILLGYFGINHVGVFTYRKVIIKDSAPIRENESIQTTVPLSLTEPGKVEAVQEANEKIRQPRVPLIKSEILTGKEEDLSEPSIRYEKSALQKEAADRIHADLTRLMHSEKIFKNAELSLGQLAEMLDVHPNNLSQVINSYEDKNFYDYINNLRIEEFKELAVMPTNSRYTFLSLAFECGFNSKTSFNRNFKKITGLSPSAWLHAADVKLDA